MEESVNIPNGGGDIMTMMASSLVLDSSMDDAENSTDTTGDTTSSGSSSTSSSTSINDSLPDSGCPSLDGQRQHHNGRQDEQYDTDYFGGSHDFDMNIVASRSIDDDDVDSMEHDEEESFDAPLSWRLDPLQSLSDWTIHIQIQHQSDSLQTSVINEELNLPATTNDAAMYYVHKNMLAVGPKASSYFSALFRSRTQTVEATTSTSTILLEESAAQAFPQLLDFMYSPTHTLEINTKSAVPLRYLAQYFGIRMLHKKVMNFLRTDITLENVDSYIVDCIKFQDAKISQFVADTCAKNIAHLDQGSQVIQTVNPHFLYHILSSNEIDTCAVSEHASRLVAAYCQIHIAQLDLDVFQKLTNRDHMPLIDRNAALSLLEIESKLQEDSSPTAFSSPRSSSASGDGTDDDNYGDQQQQQQQQQQNQQLSCVQQRCIRVLALNWKELIVDDDKIRAHSILKGLNSNNVLMELFDKSLSIAGQRLDEVMVASKTQCVNLEQKYDVQLTEEREKYLCLEERFNNLQQENEETIKRLQIQLAERDLQLNEYRRELKNFHRVPTSYSFQDVTKSTYHHLSQAEPFDSSEPSQFGRRQPTSLPRFVSGDRSGDGYLFVLDDERSKPAVSAGNNTKTELRCPVYYYREPPQTTSKDHKVTTATSKSENPRHTALRRMKQQQRRRNIVPLSTSFSSSSA